MRRWLAIPLALLLPAVVLANDRWPGGGGGGMTTWFNALQLTDPKMTSAINQATYEWHHWSVKDMRTFETESFVQIDVNDWAFANGNCIQGLGVGGTQFIYDSNGGCAAGGGTIGTPCKCTETSGSKYGLRAAAETGDPVPHMWTTALTGGPVTGIAGYSTDIRFVGYPRPMLRLDFQGADECATAEEVTKSLVFQPRDNPVAYIEATLWNWTASSPFMVANVADTIVFVGWKKDDVVASTPGFDLYIDPAVAGVNALLEAALVDAFGMMWVDSKWHAVWVKDGVIYSDVILDPVVVYGTLDNYLSLHMGGSTAFFVQTDIDNKSSGRKRGAYQVTDTTDSTNWHSNFNPFSMGVLGSPDSGFQDAGGQAQFWHRIVTACTKTGSATVLGRFFVSQMDIIK